MSQNDLGSLQQLACALEEGSPASLERESMVTQAWCTFRLGILEGGIGNQDAPAEVLPQSTMRDEAPSYRAVNTVQKPKYHAARVYVATHNRCSALAARFSVITFSPTRTPSRINQISSPPAPITRPNKRPTPPLRPSFLLPTRPKWSRTHPETASLVTAFLLRLHGLAGLAVAFAERGDGAGEEGGP